MISNLGKHAYWGQAIEGYRLIEHQVTCSVFCADGALFTWTIDLKTPNPFPTSKTCIYHKYCGRINLEIWILPSNQSILFQFNTMENATEEILALKNEPGPISTLCRKDAAGNWVLNDPPPDPAMELLKCQRYYIKSYIRYVCTKGKIFHQALTNVMFPVRMRRQPTVSLRSHLETPRTLSYFNSGVDSGIIAEVNNSYLTPDGFNAIAVTSDLEDGEFYIFMYESSADL